MEHTAESQNTKVTAKEAGLFLPVFAIASNTFKEVSRDKVVYTFFVFAVIISFFGLALGSLSVGQDLRIILDLGMFGISTIGGIIAVFAGANLVYKELEKKTCYLIFTKPVRPWQFILGKYLGLALCLLVLVAAMAVFLALTVYIADPGQLLVFKERVLWIGASLLLTYLELLLIIAAAEFFSTFSSPIMSVVFTIAFWFIGHSTASLQDLSKLFTNPVLMQLANFLYWTLPDLKTLTQTRSAIMYGQLPNSELSIYLTAYLVSYVIILLVLSAMVSEKRELP
ncbi:MAG: ABC transporter permease subunit [Candidatus Obscuribacterales bacterium]|nr:ABC transporter permease subunit [Candidatus Obscuribacterales bacterium]